MILYISNNFNSISQETYDSFIRSLDLLQIICPKCGHVHSFIFYGSYLRKVRSTSDGTSSTLRIQRIFCKHCGSVHAILPSCLVPYSQHPLHNFIQIIDGRCSPGSIADRLEVSYQYIQTIRSRFRSFWRALLPAHWMRFSLSSLSSYCFELFHRQFFQHHLSSIFILSPT